MSSSRSYGSSRKLPVSSVACSQGESTASMTRNTPSGVRPRPQWFSSPMVTPLRSATGRSEEHTSELQSQSNLVCRLLLEKKKKNRLIITRTYRIDKKYPPFPCKVWNVYL